MSKGNFEKVNKPRYLVEFIFLQWAIDPYHAYDRVKEGGYELSEKREDFLIVTDYKLSEFSVSKGENTPGGLLLDNIQMKEYNLYLVTIGVFIQPHEIRQQGLVETARNIALREKQDFARVIRLAMGEIRKGENLERVWSISSRSS